MAQRPAKILFEIAVTLRKIKVPIATVDCRKEDLFCCAKVCSAERDSRHAPAVVEHYIWPQRWFVMKVPLGAL